MISQVRKTTGILMLAGIGFYVAWDIYAALAGESGATISAVTIRELYGHPGLACIVGILLGHLTWPVAKPYASGWRELGVVSAAGVALLIAQRLLSPMAPVLPFALGVVLGHLLWPQGAGVEKTQ